MVPTVRGIRMVVPWKPVNLQEDEEGEEMYEEMDEGVLASFSRWCEIFPMENPPELGNLWIYIYIYDYI